MKNSIIVVLILSLIVPSVFALGNKNAAYIGGTTKDKDFPGAKDVVEGRLDLHDDSLLQFKHEQNKERKIFEIPYNQITDIEYGQKAGRRVAAAIATAILISPVGLFLLFSKKRKHFITIGYRDGEGKEQVAVFELGKDIVRTTLPVLEKRSGKKIEYQTEEAKKNKGN